MADVSPAEDLATALNELWTKAGRPSTRTVADRTKGSVSYSTVYSALRGSKAPRWANLVTIVEALGGDPDMFQPLWAAAYQQMQQQRAPTPPPPNRTAAAILDLAGAVRDLAAVNRELVQVLRGGRGPEI